MDHSNVLPARNGARVPAPDKADPGRAGGLRWELRSLEDGRGRIWILEPDLGGAHGSRGSQRSREEGRGRIGILKPDLGGVHGSRGSQQSREEGRGRIWVLVAAAAVALAVAAWAVMVRRAAPSQPVQGPSEPREAVALIEPRGQIDELPREFRWDPVAGADRYRVTIADEDAVWPLLVRTTRDTTLTLADGDVSAITPGRIHSWEVEALDAKGAPIALGESRFLVVPTPPP